MNENTSEPRHVAVPAENDEADKKAVPSQNTEPSENFRAKIIGYRWDFLKFFLGSIVLGAATAISTHIFRSYELKIESRKTESTYLQEYSRQFLEITKNDEYTRGIDMADFLRLSAVDEDLKKAWTDVRDHFQKKLDNLKQANNEAQKKTNDLSQDIGEKHAKIQSLIEKSKTDKSYTRTNFIADSTKLISQAIEAEKKLQFAVEKKTEINSILKTALSKTSSDVEPIDHNVPSYEIIYDQDRFVGRGYFNQITDDITVRYMKKTNGILVVSARDEDVEFNLLKSTMVVKQFKDGHRISINMLGEKNMGINVFNKEISYHIKVEKLKNPK